MLSTLCQRFRNALHSPLSHNINIISRGKHKIPRRRATSLLNELQNEEFDMLRSGRDFPKFKAGDAIQIDHLPNRSSNDPIKMRGLVISKTNRKHDSRVVLLNTQSGTPFTRSVLMYSPLVTNIKILQRDFIHNGKKRTRRSKLYYMLNRRPDEYTVSNELGEVQGGISKKKINKKK